MSLKIGGRPNQMISRCPKKKAHATDGKEIIELRELDGTRKLIIPSRTPSVDPRIFTREEFKGLKSKAHVTTTEDRMAIIEQAEKKRKQLEEESISRKNALKNAQKEQLLASGGTKLSSIEADAKKKTFYLLKRAFDLRQEQEDEVKKANQLILASKCLAIRAAQVAEKELIKKEIEEEEKRLDQMMEEERRKGLQKEEDKRNKEKEKNQRFVEEMQAQIKEREIEKIQEGERIEEEARMQNKALIQMQRDEEQKRRKKIEEQEQMRNDLARANFEISRYKQTQREEERIADLRVQEFMKKKAAREAAREEEIKLQKIAKEKEIARLRELQERQQDQQAALDEMNALRVQEEVEREWRKKEKEVAEKKARDEENLKNERHKQIEDIRRRQAIELKREEQDFFKVVQVQKELHQKEEEKQARRKEENIKHRLEILAQVNEKERERINRKKQTFEEGIALQAEKETRLRHIENALRGKMTKLRDNKVPEIVVRDIERQLNII